MNLLALRTEIRLRAGLADNDGIFTDANLTSLLNSSLRRISVMHDWPWLEEEGSVSSEADTSTITIPDYRKVLWVRHEDSRLPFVSQRKRADYYGLTGSPVSWTEFAGAVHLLPTPDKVYEITYGIIKKADNVLATDTDSPLVPDWAIDLLVSDACMLVARRNKDTDRERVFFSERERFKQSILDDVPNGGEGMLPDSPSWRRLS